MPRCSRSTTPRTRRWPPSDPFTTATVGLKVSLDPRLAAHAARVESRLPELLPAAGERPEAVHEAMRYAALGGGKRVRPVLTLAVAEMLGGRDSTLALDLGCAVELVHASSLVLDDLPSMDDAELRRGRATTHRAHGEDLTILAAFALLNRAFELVADVARRAPLRRWTGEDLLHHLGGAVGPRGLVGGQALHRGVDRAPRDAHPGAEGAHPLDLRPRHAR